MTFTWIPFYEEFARKLLQFRNDRTPLVNWIYDNLEGHITHFKDAPDGRRVPDTDPFTVFAIVNRNITYDKKKSICAKFKGFLNISVPIPEDFTSVPEMNNMRSNFIAFEDGRKEGDIERLWNVFEDAVLDRDIENSYNALSNQYLISKNLTIGLFWIRPSRYLALDGNNVALLKSYGIAKVSSGFVLYEEYKEVMNRLDAKIKSGELECANYAEFSQLAYEGTSTRDTGTEYWIYSPGENASKWELCINDGIMCIGWDVLGDLSDYSSREEMHKKIKLHYPSKGSAKNDTLAVWQFSNEMKPGDIVFAKKGRNTIIGRGVVESDYEFDESRDDYKHIRKVNWTNIGEWFIDDAVAVKTLTNITRDTDYITKLNNLVDGTSEEVSEKEESCEAVGVNYWWLTGKPKYWSPTKDWELGEDVDYTLYSEEGNKRRIFKHFFEAKPNDVVIVYEATPVLQIVAIGKVMSETNGEVLFIRKVEELSTPIPYSEILTNPILEESEPARNRCQGSLFRLTKKEYDEVMRLIRIDNPEPKGIKKEKYDKSDFLDEVFVSEGDYDSLKNLLLRKKNLILQGAPGVGKTFAAKRMAYAMMGEKDEDRIMQVQFHQNYSYEDFVMGYKPNENGGFDLKNGIFYEFCKRAEKDGERKYFFIIDEINRGNLSKIFGELLMLIENDYRDKPIHMAYRDEEFAVPANLYIIGMMNTADRSLAMIDYALRRRFSFFEMKPGFENPIFREKIKKQNDQQLESLVKAIIELNKVIENDDSLGSGFCIGHSYLCNMGDQYNLANIVEYDIVPMLSEYWFDNNERFNQEAQKLRNALK